MSSYVMRQRLFQNADDTEPMRNSEDITRVRWGCWKRPTV